MKRESVNLIGELIDFCETLGKTDYKEIKSVMEKGGQPLSESAVEVVSTLDGVVSGEIKPSDIIKLRGLVPILGYRGEDQNIYSLVFTGELEWVEDWIRFKDGEFSLIKEPEGDIIASVNKSVYPQNTVDYVEVVAMVANNAPVELVEERLRKLERQSLVRRTL